MRRHRVLLSDLREGVRTVRGPEAHHLRDVLRASVGTEVEAFDGEGLRAAGRVVAVGPHGVDLELRPPEAGGSEPRVAVTMAVALLKGDKLGDVVRKGTELGVHRFSPFVAARCDARALSDGKLRRYRRIAAEAAKQAGRDRVPEVSGPVPLDALPLTGTALVAVPGADATVRGALEGLDEAALTVVTGPEGGLGEDEVRALEVRGALAVRLAPRVLRAETAPIALAAALLVPDAW